MELDVWTTILHSTQAVHSACCVFLLVLCGEREPWKVPSFSWARTHVICFVLFLLVSKFSSFSNPAAAMGSEDSRLTLQLWLSSMLRSPAVRLHRPSLATNGCLLFLGSYVEILDFLESVHYCLKKRRTSFGISIFPARCCPC